MQISKQKLKQKIASLEGQQDLLQARVVLKLILDCLDEPEDTTCFDAELTINGKHTHGVMCVKDSVVLGIPTPDLVSKPEGKDTKPSKQEDGDFEGMVMSGWCYKCGGTHHNVTVCPAKQEDWAEIPPFKPDRTECKHGRLARGCNECELERDIEKLQAKVQRYKEELEAITKNDKMILCQASKDALLWTSPKPL